MRQLFIGVLFLLMVPVMGHAVKLGVYSDYMLVDKLQTETELFNGSTSLGKLGDVDLDSGVYGVGGELIFDVFYMLDYTLGLSYHQAARPGVGDNFEFWLLDFNGKFHFTPVNYVFGGLNVSFPDFDTTTTGLSASSGYGFQAGVGFAFFPTLSAELMYQRIGFDFDDSSGTLSAKSSEAFFEGVKARLKFVFPVGV